MTTINSRINSKFVNNIQSDLNRLNLICQNPIETQNRFKEILSLHNSIDQMLNQYNSSSIDQVKEDVLKIVEEENQKYKTSYKSDLKNHVIKQHYKLKSIPSVNYDLQIFNEDLYNSLLSYVNPDVDPRSKEGMKTINKFFEVSNEIEDNINDLSNSIQQFEQDLVDYRSKLLKSVRTASKIIYDSHLSFLSTVKNQTQSTQPIYININGENIKVEGRQTEFIKNCLRKYLSQC